MPITIHEGLCDRLRAREMPEMVPPVPAPATRTSTLPEVGRPESEGAVTAAIISGPVPSSWAKGLCGLVYWLRTMLCGIARSRRFATPCGFWLSVSSAVGQSVRRVKLIGAHRYDFRLNPKRLLLASVRFPLQENVMWPPFRATSWLGV